MQEFTQTEENFMRRCIQLAKMGAGNVAPNPMVGSIIVYNNKIIGEGYHRKFGQSHAEVNAINSVKDKELLSKSELYVTLEPCAHFGKTPPCADLIIEKKIKKVYIGCRDSFEKVDGKGIQKLKNAGVDVKIGLLEAECLELNKRFFTFFNKKRPYVILKWAQTLDGFIDKKREPNSPPTINRISSQQANWLVQKMRGEEQAILIGAQTAINDNPQLTARLNNKNPIRIVIDKNLSLNQNLKIFDNNAKTLIFSNIEPTKPLTLNQEIIKIDFNENIAAQILEKLYNYQIQSVIVEGGTKTHNLFIKSNLWDEAIVFTGNKIFKQGTKAAEISGNLVFQTSIGESQIMIFKNENYLNFI